MQWNVQNSEVIWESKLLSQQQLQGKVQIKLGVEVLDMIWTQ